MTAGSDETLPGHGSAPAPAGDETLAAVAEPRTDVGLDERVLDLPRGAVLGRYLVLERLGVGGMGVVYAAYDPELDRKVAVKLLRTGAGEADGTDGRARLLREAQALAKLSHPNVVAVHDVGTIAGSSGGDVVFVAM